MRLKLFLRFLFVFELILAWIVGWASAGRLQEYDVRMVLMEDNGDEGGSFLQFC